MGLGKICSATFVLVFGLVQFGGAEAFAADPLAYRFKGVTEAVYQVTIKADTPDSVETQSGTMTYNIESVDPANGQIQFAFASQLNKQSQPKGNNNNRRPGGFPPFPPMSNPFQPAPAAPQIMMSPQGAVLRSNRSDDASHLPYMLGVSFQLLLPPLSRDGASTWKEEQTITMYTKTAEPNRSTPPWERQAQERVDRPARETVNYSLGQVDGATIQVIRKYELATEEKKGNTPLLAQVGEARYVFDREAGLVRSMEMTCSIVMNDDNVSIRIPITVTAKLLTEAQMAELKAKRAADVAAGQAAMAEHLKRVEDQNVAQIGTTRTELVGMDGGGNVALIEMPKRPVVGVRFGRGNWAGHKCVGSAKPLYEKPTDAAPANGIDYIAKPGYAVGGMVVTMDKTSKLILSSQLIFMRLEKNRLLTTDQYRSPLLNPTGGAGQTTKVVLGGKGDVVLGFFGSQGMNLNKIGLILDSENAKPSSNPSTKPQAAEPNAEDE